MCRSCGDGFKLLLPNPDALTCYGAALQVFPCNLGPCPHDCAWSPWSPWSACTPAPTRHRSGHGHGIENSSRHMFGLGTVSRETRGPELPPSILAICLVTRFTIMGDITAPTMVSRSLLPRATEPPCWGVPWSVSRVGTGSWTTPPSTEVTSATARQSRRGSASLPSVSGRLAPRGLRGGMDCRAEMAIRGHQVCLASGERPVTQARMAAPAFPAEMARTACPAPRVLQARMASMVTWDLLALLVCPDLRVHRELLDLEAGLVTRELMDQWGRQGHPDPRARTAAMAPLGPLDPRDLTETLAPRV